MHTIDMFCQAQDASEKQAKLFPMPTADPAVSMDLSSNDVLDSNDVTASKGSVHAAKTRRAAKMPLSGRSTQPLDASGAAPLAAREFQPARNDPSQDSHLQQARVLSRVLAEREKRARHVALKKSRSGVSSATRTGSNLAVDLSASGQDTYAIETAICSHLLASLAQSTQTSPT